MFWNFDEAKKHIRIVHNGFLITAGGKGSLLGSGSSDVFMGQVQAFNSTYVPALPSHVDSQCMARLDENLVGLAGGTDGIADLDSFQVFDIGSNVWIPKPSMVEARLGPACGAVQSNGTWSFVVAGIFYFFLVWRDPGVSLKGRISRLPEQPCWLYA